MIDKKEKKRDVATFANDMKNIMNIQTDNPLDMLDRDIQNFIFGRVAMLVKHNEDDPIGSVGDVSFVIGGAFGNLMKMFCQHETDQEKLDNILKGSLGNMALGFQKACGILLEPTETADT